MCCGAALVLLLKLVSMRQLPERAARPCALHISCCCQLELAGSVACLMGMPFYRRD
jgi:hypothetical protein